LSNKVFFFFITLICSFNFGYGQFQINGNASQTSCNCYELTPNAGGQVGSVWNTNLIDLNQPFDFNFQVFLGCNNGGADGLVFGLQPNSTAVGTSGGGMGFQNVAPSLGVFIDTYQNGINNDPVDDHISINLNGDINHTSVNNVSGPIGLGNIEDCQYHDLQITWNPTTTTYEVYFDGVLLLSYVNDIITNVFGGNSTVYWGFTAATGGASNEQGFCMELNPGFIDVNSGAGCAGDPIQFTDTSASFGSIQSWAWNFGDGSTSSLQNPIYTYINNGSYPVSLTVTDNAGCSAETVTNVIVGAPDVSATASPNPICAGQTLQLDAAIASSGSNCDYSLEMFDAFGDGWNGAYVEIFENGASIGQIGDGPLGSGFGATAADPNQQTDIFTVTDGSALDFVWGNDGTFPTECSYNLFDSQGNNILAQNYAGGSPGAGVTVLSIAATCPNAVTYNYSWNPTALLSNSAIQNPTTVLTSTSVFTVTADNGSGCTSSSEIIVTVTTPSVGISATPNLACAGQVIQLNTSITAAPPANSNCDYSLEMFDGFGDGWNGAYVEIFEDGVSIGQIGDGPLGSGFNAGAGPQVDLINVNGGATLDFVWASDGGFPTECSFNICDNTGTNILFQDYAGGSPGVGTVVLSTIAACPTVAVTPTYSWTSTPFISDANIQNPTTQITATTIYAITADDGAGCIGTNQVTITLSNPPLAITLSTPTCNLPPDGTATADIIGTNTPYSYSWDNNTNNQTTSTATGLGGGTYSITITDNSGCYTTSIISVTASPGVTISPQQTNATCNSVCDGTAWFTATGGTAPYTYIWSTGGSNPFSSNLCAGVYGATTTDNLGCFNANSYTITEPTGISVTNFSVTSSNCGQLDGIVSINEVTGGLSNYSFIWDNAEIGPIASNLSAGSHTVSITLNSAACNSVFNVSLTDTPGPSLSTLNTPEICNGSCDGTSTAIGFSNGGSGTFSYSWSINNQNTQVATGLCAGQYVVTATDMNGCQAITTSNISQPNVITVNVSAAAQIVCIGQCTDITALAAGGNGSPYTYIWNTGSGSTIQACPTMQTFYNVTATDLNGCTSEQAVPVLVDVYPNITVIPFGDNTICEGATTSIGAIGYGGNGGPYTYSWNNFIGSGSMIDVTPISYPSPTTYTVTVSDGCSNKSATVTVQFNPTPSPLFAADSVGGCEPFSTAIYPIVGSLPNSTTCIWNVDGETTYTNNCSSIFLTFPEAGNHDIALTAISNDGCAGSYTWPNMISVYELPNANFINDPNPPTTLNSQVQFTDNSEGSINSWNWTFFDKDSINILETSINYAPNVLYPSAAGNYPVNLEIETWRGCKDDTTISLIIEGELKFYLPTAFSPNGDGLNDVFGIKGIGIDTLNFNFIITNRWGELLFETNDINESWDGFYSKGGRTSKVPFGVYIWKLVIKGDESTDFNARTSVQHIGHVALVK